MSVYHGTKFGFVQSAVYDQMGISLAGRLANASDINLCDAVSVGETAGIGVGLGVCIASLSGAKKPGINDTQLKLPTAASTDADFAGILVRTDTGRTDADGNTYMGYQEIGTLLRKERVGGRIWIKAEGNITTNGSLYWIVADTANTGKKIGGFMGSNVSGDTVLIPGVKVVAGAEAGKLALIEVGVSAGYATNASVASAYQPKLTAGANVAISDENVISATDTTYTAGTGIEISDANVISTTQG